MSIHSVQKSRRNYYRVYEIDIEDQINPIVQFDNTKQLVLDKLNKLKLPGFKLNIEMWVDFEKPEGINKEGEELFKSSTGYFISKALT